jgi:predicted DNA-binding protein (MmcQ/YjbR family)
MKVTVKEVDKKEKERTYPYIGIHKAQERLVLFTAPKKGITLRKDNNYAAGYYMDGWGESLFDVFDGQITLENGNPPL